MINTLSKRHIHAFYWPDLDGVRGVAVSAVLLVHGSYGYFSGGFLGVDLFFSLSGFLITSLLVQEWERTGGIGLKRFYMRRVLRLYPALVITVMAAFFVWPSSARSLYWRSALGALFYHANFLTIDPNPLAHTWSLSIEEQFYLFWPPLLMSILPLQKRYRVWLIFVAVLASLGVRLIMVYMGASPFTIYRFTFARTDSLLCGCAAALLLGGRGDGKKSQFPNWLPNVTSIGCISLFCWLVLKTNQWEMWMMTWGFTAVALLCAALVVAAASLRGSTPISWFLRSPAMKYLGTRSYGLYLYHYLIFPEFEPLRKPHSIGNFLFVTAFRVGATFIAVELSFRFIERPFLKLKRIFESDDQIEQAPTSVA